MVVVVVVVVVAVMVWGRKINLCFCFIARDIAPGLNVSESPVRDVSPPTDVELMPPPVLPQQAPAPAPPPLHASHFPHPEPLPPTVRPVPVGRRDGEPDWVKERGHDEVFFWERKKYSSEATSENARYLKKKKICQQAGLALSKGFNFQRAE